MTHRTTSSPKRRSLDPTLTLGVDCVHRGGGGHAEDPLRVRLQRSTKSWRRRVHRRLASLANRLPHQGNRTVGGPRLWDLKGLDYFWGVLHPALMVIVFDVTGSIDIVLDRLVSIAFGVAAAVFRFHICRYH